jgi:hypothetical protein
MSYHTFPELWRQTPARVTRTRAANPSLRSLVGGRVTIDQPSDAFSKGLMAAAGLSPLDERDTFRGYGLDAALLDRISPTKLMELLANYSPDVSRALWDFQRFCNPGWEAKAYKLGSESTIDKTAQEALTGPEGFLKNLHGPYSEINVVPANVIIGALFLSCFLRGALFSELILDESGQLPLELATPDPATVKFERAEEPPRGRVWKAYQWQGGQKVYLDRPTISYIPIDPFPGSPYGRPLASPALFSTLFLLGLLHDLRRVVAQQGWPRLDIEISFDKLKEMMPDDLQNDPSAAKEWVDGIVEEIKSFYASLSPDAAYVHLDVAKLNQPLGTVDASSLKGIDGIVGMLERMNIKALKSNALLMVYPEGIGEANSNRLWETHSAGVKSIQHPCEDMLARQCGLALRARGLAARVEFKFSELRASEMQRDEITKGLKIQNAARARDEGFISQDEAAKDACGKEKAFAAAPVRPTQSSGSAPGTGIVPDPGSERMIELDLDDKLNGHGRVIG